MNNYPITIGILAINRETAEKLMALKMKWAEKNVYQDLTGLVQSVADACVAKITAQNKLMEEGIQGEALANYKPVHKITVMVPANSYAEAQDKIRSIFLASAIPVNVGWGVLAGIIAAAILFGSTS